MSPVKPKGCPPDCWALTLADLWPSDDKPEDMSDKVWNQVMMQQHADGCPTWRKVEARHEKLRKEAAKAQEHPPHA